MKSFNIGILLMLSLVGLSQDSWINFTNNYTTTDIIEQEDGFWLGSTGGLCYVNSLSNDEEYYNRGNSDLPSNSIHDLLLHPNDDLWITSSLGICKLTNGEFTLGDENLTGILRINPENKIVVANNDSLYIQTNEMEFEAIAYPNYVADFGGFEIDSEGTIYLNVINFFAETYVAIYKDDQWEIIFSDFIYETAITLDSQNRLWFLSSLGLKYYENDNWIDVTEVDTSDQFSQAKMFVDFDDHIIMEIGSDCPKLFKWDGIEISEISFIQDECSDCRFVKPSSKEGDKYFAYNRRNGFYEFNSNDIDDYQAYSQSPINYNSITTTLHPMDGSHWIIHSDKIQKYATNEWTEIPIPSGISSNIKFAQLGLNDMLWISEYDKLWFYDNDQWTSVLAPSQFTEIRNFVIGANGDLWIQSGTNIAQLINGEWNNFTAGQHDLTSGIIQDMKVDPKNGDLWVSSFQGIRHYDGQTWTRYDFLPNNHMFALAIGDEGVFARQTGMHYIKDGIVEVIPMPTEGYYGNFESKMVYDTFDHKLYLTGANHLAVYDHDNNEWLVHNTKNSGIYNGYSRNISVDPKGNVWLSGNGGGLEIFNENGILLSSVIPESNLNALEINVFPTLVHGNKVFVTSLHSGTYNLYISEVSGKVLQGTILQLYANEKKEIELPNVNSTFLFLTFEQGGVISTQKLIKL